jgi:hypothetical protein
MRDLYPLPTGPECPLSTSVVVTPGSAPLPSLSVREAMLILHDSFSSRTTTPATNLDQPLTTPTMPSLDDSPHTTLQIVTPPSIHTISPLSPPHPARGTMLVSTTGSRGTMTLSHLAWNCRGSGGSLCSSTMPHLSRQLLSTKS